MARAWADVSLDSVAANVETLRAVAAPAEVCVVVKADGYGHGSVPVARAAVEAGATWLAVAQVPEAVALRAGGLGTPILLLAEPRPDELEAALAAGVTLTVYTRELIHRLEVATAGRAGRPVSVHLKVDTGMHRVGAAPADVVDLAKALAAAPALSLDALWTHCAVADDPDDGFTSLQLQRFEETLGAVRDAGIEVPMRHAANSAAAIAHPASRYDLVRCGIAIYGIAPSPSLAGHIELHPALRLVTEVAFLKRVGAGDGVSYGLAHHLAHDTVVATLPIGYADGVFRGLGMAGQEVLINGGRYRMVGVVTMDQVMVDLGADSTVEVGAEAVLLGTQHSERILPEEWAARLGTIAYEVVCALGPRVERRYGNS